MDDRHRAASMLDAVLAHRAEKRAGELAATAAAYHDQVGTVGGIKEHLHAMAADGPRASQARGVPPGSPGRWARWPGAPPATSGSPMQDFGHYQASAVTSSVVSE